MSNQEEVFDADTIRSLGLEYKNRKVRTLNKTGYMRNYLCEISQKFCLQSMSERDTLLEIGCGLGASLKTLILNGARNVVAVDPEPRHLEIVRVLLKQTLLDHSDAKLTTICDRLPYLIKLENNSFRSILCAQTLHYMKPEEFEYAVRRMYKLLNVGGTLYATVGSPYLKMYKGFGEEYERRLDGHDNFPGYMRDVKKYHPTGESHNPGFFLFFDPVVLADKISEAGFKVLEASYIDDADINQAQTGIIAIKE